MTVVGKKLIRVMGLALLIVTGLQALPAQANTSPLINVQWLLANPASATRVLLDLRDPRSYVASHIPGAVHTDYGMDGWRQMIDKVPGLLPTKGPQLDKLVRRIGQLGISNSSHVVLVAPGWSAGDMGMATRLYWSLKVLGHDRVSILDGGMAAWLADMKADRKTPRNPLRRGSEKNPPQQFVPSIRQDMLMNVTSVSQARARGHAALDARPTMQYLGLQQSSSVMAPGTLKGAVSLPGQWVTENSGGHFRPASALQKLLAVAGVGPASDMFVFCNTGHWASLTWFVASELLGHKQVRLYDGSLADWTAIRSAGTSEPLVQKIRLN